VNKKKENVKVLYFKEGLGHGEGRVSINSDQRVKLNNLKNLSWTNFPVRQQAKPSWIPHPTVPIKNGFQIKFPEWVHERNNQRCSFSGVLWVLDSEKAGKKDFTNCN